MLIIYRLFRVYNKWRLTNNRLSNIRKMLEVDSDSVQYSSLLIIEQSYDISLFGCCHSCKYIVNKRYALRIVRIYICIIFALMFVSRIFDINILARVIWTLLMLTAILMIFKSRKIKETMLVIKEVWALTFTMMLMTISNIILATLSSSVWKHLIGFAIGNYYILLLYFVYTIKLFFDCLYSLWLCLRTIWTIT